MSQRKIKIEVLDYDGLFADGYIAVWKGGEIVAWRAIPVF